MAKADSPEFTRAVDQAEPRVEQIEPQWFNVWKSETSDTFRTLSVVNLDPRSVYLGQILNAATESWRIIKLDLLAGRIDVSLQRVEKVAEEVVNIPAEA